MRLILVGHFAEMIPVFTYDDGTDGHRHNMDQVTNVNRKVTYGVGCRNEELIQLRSVSDVDNVE